MKLKDIKNEIKVLDVAGLVAKAKALKIEINDFVLDKNINKLKDLKSINKKRKYLARVFTVLNQKKMIGSLEAKSQSVKVAAEPKVEKTKKMDKEVTEKKGAKK